MTPESYEPLLFWQLADSAFPTGSFTHSGGLEAAFQHGEVANISELRQFAYASAWQAGRAGLPCVHAAYVSPEQLADFDALMEAFLTNPVANRASRLQGRSFVSACARAFPCDVLGRLEEDVRRGSLNGHLAPLFGMVLRTLRAAWPDASLLYVYLAVRGVLAAGVRLGIVGPLKAQQLQADSRTEIDRVVQRCASVNVDDLAQASPLLDLFQGTHDRLYSRLFQS